MKGIKMYKATYKNIKWLLDCDGSRDVEKIFEGIQPRGYDIAYYTPSTANWCYGVSIVKLDNKIYEVVTQFGVVRGGRELPYLESK